MKILGISAFYHDSAAAIIENENIIAAAQEERFTRKKQDASFPSNAIRFCLDYAGFSIDELDAIVFYDKPLLKFERLLETYYGFAPKGLQSFITAIPVWLKEKMFLKHLLYKELQKIEPFNKKKLKLLFPEHHLSHAASAFYPSPFEEAAILTIDGVGEWATATISHGKGKNITILKELQFPHSLGLLYSAFTYFLGFKVNSGEYKLMGLAPYGNPHSEAVKSYIQTIKTKLIDLKSDGSIWLNQKHFSYATGLRMVNDKKWAALFGFPRRIPETPLEQHHCDLAYAIQQVTEEVVLTMAKEAKRLTNAPYLCLAGGVALNCVANGKLIQSRLFDSIFIQPAAGDAGGALGSALAALHIFFEKERLVSPQKNSMKGAYLGPEYSNLDIERTAKKHKATYQKYNDFNALVEVVASQITQGKIIGWFQGRMEFGPRALGNRSILGDPTNVEMQQKINLKIKYRESFRPFAPSVLEENIEDYFELTQPSPYMLLVAPVKKSIRATVPSNYWELSLKKRLSTLRSKVQAITHVDFSARIQSVSTETNQRYHQLISAFKKQTGYAVLINTSFNVRGEPIVCSTDDAYNCFMRTGMDTLVMGNYLFKKEKQPVWVEKNKRTFAPD